MLTRWFPCAQIMLRRGRLLQVLTHNAQQQAGMESSSARTNTGAALAESMCCLKRRPCIMKGPVSTGKRHICMLN
jgi:hypothetical protein